MMMQVNDMTKETDAKAKVKKASRKIEKKTSHWDRCLSIFTTSMFSNSVIPMGVIETLNMNKTIKNKSGKINLFFTLTFLSPLNVMHSCLYTSIEYFTS